MLNGHDFRWREVYLETDRRELAEYDLDGVGPGAHFQPRQGRGCSLQVAIDVDVTLRPDRKLDDRGRNGLSPLEIIGSYDGRLCPASALGSSFSRRC